MAYQVIARKYRPQRFEDVVGQEHVTQTLRNAIAQGRIAHAYLFCGPRGTGKTTIARIFAKCLNCTGGPKAEFDETDPRVREIAEGRALDVLEIDGASNNGVEQVRELRETANYAPASGKFKIYIIDEVHMLSAAAFNALLKTLEEPPAHVKFMFATTDPEKVLPTILSRCQRFDLRRIPAALIVQHLKLIAEQEGVQLTEAALFAIARGADGGMRDAESTLDQLISFCGGQIEEPDVLSMFGLTAQTQVIGLARAILDGDAAGALRLLDALAKHGKDLGRLLSDLLGHFRNLLIYRVTRGDTRMLELSEAEAAALKAQSTLTTPEGCTRVMEVLSDAETRLRDAASKRILVEVSLLNAIEARNAVSVDALLKQLQQLRGAAGAPTAPTPSAAAAGSPPTGASLQTAAPPPPAPAVAALADAPEPLPEAPPVASTSAVTLSPAELQSLWAKVLEAAGRASAFTRTYLLEVHPVSFAANVLTLGLAPEFSDHLGLVDTARTHTLLQNKLAEHGHPGAQVKFIVAEPPPRRTAPAAPTALSAEAFLASKATPAAPGATAAAPSATPTKRAKTRTPAPPMTMADFKDDPLIKKALETFRGEIVEVRA